MQVYFNKIQNSRFKGRRETEDGRRETGDGRRKTEDGRRETGDGRRKTEDGRLQGAISNGSNIISPPESGGEPSACWRTGGGLSLFDKHP
ncbi:MAG: hypothetical protein MUC78_10470 [Bacteroidales bacterium]|nr:hypothetical protein [Bacteroidales bacterium]